MLLERVYTRKNALEKRELIDVSTMAEDNGFSVSVAITKELNRILKENIPTVTEKNSTEYDGFPLNILNQDYKGRLNDVLWMANLERNRDKCRGKAVLGFTMFLPHYKTIVKKGENRDKLTTRISLKLIKDRGDHGESVVTIMLPEEEYIW